jgi:hypothetical protein
MMRFWAVSMRNIRPGWMRPLVTTMSGGMSGSTPASDAITTWSSLVM